jgi:hypothetical protein
VIISLLDTVLQVRRPVRVNLIGTRFVPTLRCFGPLPRASSEGFLDTFTPDRKSFCTKRGGEVILSYPFSTKCFFFHEGRQSIRGPGRRMGYTKYPSPRLLQERQYCPRGREEHLSREVRTDVMTPVSIDIGVSCFGYWNPRIQLMRPFRKGRKPLRWWTKQVPLGIPVSDLYTKECSVGIQRKT